MTRLTISEGHLDRNCWYQKEPSVMVNCAFIVGPLQYWTMREVFGMQCVRMRPPSQGTLEQPLWLQRDPENSRSLLSVLCECAWMVKLAAAEFHTWKLDRGKLRRRSGWIKLSAEIANGYWMINIWHFPQWKFIDWVEYGLLLYISSSTKPSPVHQLIPSPNLSNTINICDWISIKDREDTATKMCGWSRMKLLSNEYSPIVQAEQFPE